MPDLVEAIRAEIDARPEELRPLAREASDLQSALDALNGCYRAAGSRWSPQTSAVRAVSRTAAFGSPGGRRARPRHGVRSCEPRLYRERRGEGARAQSEIGR